MRRVALFAFVLLAGAVHAGPEESAVQIVRLSFADNEWGVMEPRTSFGSGTVVWAKDGKALVLTCKHVVPDGDAYVWARAGNTLHEGKFVAAAEKDDLALVEIKAPVKAAPVAAAEPKKGTDLRQWGHPWAGRTRPKHGPAVGDEGHADEKGRKVYIIGFGSEPGDSGAGVFDPAGCLVGVCCVRFAADPDKAGCVPLKEILAFFSDKLPK